ncbi:4-coumarate--CoA ligase 1-like [Nylanderia fulva]|uniref:4-coumarate--CoA ligase 1-like n=1 Tax=Nylanderia fulva TaxID=613905 RepID=UPI0010FBBC13|nr:4-coumarate--CoA ligase 1-like [Nylanderia fulva]XP_029156733.1 4-coumarate--CoA ligase 1-like [Nylanderia fulva]XP_029156741.1 4-coumarate--CoA ligase 1-like [Nylanderia fulva]
MAVDNSKNFTMENNVYKGKTSTYTNNYKSVGEMVWVKIKSHGDKIAHLDARTEEVVTYTKLQDKVVRCALWLQKQGIKSGDVVSVCTHNHLNSIVPCLAAVYINAIFNSWDENMDLRTALHVMQLTRPKVIFCSEKPTNIILSAIKESKHNPIIAVFGQHPDIISFSDILNTCTDAEIADFQYIELDDIKKTVCIVHSSGTTGMPKGVEMSNYTLLSISEDNNLNMTNAISIWFSSLYWISGVMMNFKAIAQGAKVIIYPEFNEEMTCILIEKYKVTLIFLSTSMINRFLKADYVKKYPLLSLETIICGGAAIKSKAQEKMRHILPHVQMSQAYGMTELGGIATMQLSNHKNGSCGTVVENVQLKIVDPENENILGPNQAGEVWVKTATMMNGYYKNLEATKNTIDKEGWLHSGDIGYIDEDGELFIIDRIKELIKYRGYQISPGEIEDVLLLHKAVMETAVVGVPHAIDDEHPIAYVTIKSGVKITEQELIDFVSNNMMDQYRLRAGVIFLETFPYTGSGKIARKDLRAMAKKLAVEN